MPSEQPVVVLVHGAWHRPLHYIQLLTALQDVGFTVVAPPLPSGGWNGRNATATVEDDAEVIRQAMQPHFDIDRDVIVLGHSYGGLPATEAVFGNSIEERKARGEKGGVKAALFVVSIVATTSNSSLLEILGQDLSDGTPFLWDLPKDLQNGRLSVLNENAKPLLYDDVDEIVGRASFDACVPQSLASFQSPSTHTVVEVRAKKFYIVTENDKSAPYEIQLRLAEAGEMGTYTVASGHSPFLTQKGVARLVEIIQEVAKDPLN